jgi:hypothetical protein
MTTNVMANRSVKMNAEWDNTLWGMLMNSRKYIME